MLQFPARTRGTITMWVRYVDPITGNHINVRVPLNGCFWNDDSVSIFQKTGQQVGNNVTIYVPYSKDITGREFITPEEWAGKAYDELKDYWTVNLRQAPIMLSGENDFEFDWGTSAQVTTAQNNFVASNPSIKTVRDFNPMLFGSKKMWHFVIRGA